MSDAGHIGVRGTGVAIAIAASAIVHVGLLTVLDAVDGRPARVVSARRPRLTLEPLPAPPPRPIDDAIAIELVVLAPERAPRVRATASAAPTAVGGFTNGAITSVTPA